MTLFFLGSLVVSLVKANGDSLVVSWDDCLNCRGAWRARAPNDSRSTTAVSSSLGLGTVVLYLDFLLGTVPPSEKVGRMGGRALTRDQRREGEVCWDKSRKRNISGHPPLKPARRSSNAAVARQGRRSDSRGVLGYCWGHAGRSVREPANVEKKADRRRVQNAICAMRWRSGLWRAGGWPHTPSHQSPLPLPGMSSSFRRPSGAGWLFKMSVMSTVRRKDLPAARPAAAREGGHALVRGGRTALSFQALTYTATS